MKNKKINAQQLALKLLQKSKDSNNKLSLLMSKGRQQKKCFQINSDSQMEALQFFAQVQNEESNHQKPSSKQILRSQQKKKQVRSILKNKKQIQDIDIQQEEEQKVIQKQKKSVSFIGQQKPIIVFGVEKKWNQQIENQKKGKFDVHQQKLLDQAVKQFLSTNGIQQHEFKQYIILKDQINTLRRQKFFKIISSVLPNRSPQSCYKYIMRKYNIYNKQGQWTPQQIQQLLALVDKYGRKWTLISKILKRTSDNVYDKYRSLGEEGFNQRQRQGFFWNLRQILTLLFIIKKQTKIEFIQQQAQELLQQEQIHNKKQQQQRQKHKYNTKSFTFHIITVLNKYINSRALKKIDLGTIKWNKIVLKIPNKTVFDCRNKFVQIMQTYFRDDSNLDIELSSFLSQYRPPLKNENDINWKKWPHVDYTIQQAKNRLMILKKLISGRSYKMFDVIIAEIKNRCQNYKKNK